MPGTLTVNGLVAPLIRPISAAPMYLLTRQAKLGCRFDTELQGCTPWRHRLFPRSIQTSVP